MDYFPLFLTDQDQMIVRIIRQFVNREIIPIRDKIDDDSEHIIINKILSKICDLGFNGSSLLCDDSDTNRSLLSFVTSSIITEELSRGDVGIGIVTAITGWAMMPAYFAKNSEVLNAYKSMSNEISPLLVCFAMTEPDSGCDIENLPNSHGKTIRTSAVRDGDYWVLNGTKRFPSSAGISSLYCIVCQTDLSKGEEGIALIYVPKDTAGLSFGKFEKKAGLQSDRNADIFLNDVRVPVSYRASGPGRDAELLKANLTIGRLASAAAAVGCARATFEEVLKYTGEKNVSGKPIRDHSIVAGILAEMSTGIETARAHYLQVAYMLNNPENFGDPFSDFILSQASISKNYATEMAISVTNKAMELMGSYSYIRDYHVEKYWRDAKIIQLWLGGPQLGRFDIMRNYYPYDTQ